MTFKPILLSIVPPYPWIGPPAGAAALLGYLKANGVFDFGFLDLRLAAPKCFKPIYTLTGIFGESYVMDVPDLPLILELLVAVHDRAPYVPGMTDLFDRYCFERGIPPSYLRSYLVSLDHYLATTFQKIPKIEFIGFSVWTSNYLSTILAAYHLKRRRSPPFVVVGGPQVSESFASADLGLRSGLFDTVVLGEGEETLLALYNNFRAKGKQSVGGINGTRWLDSGSGRIRSSERPPISVTELPLPCFDEMFIDAYQIDDFRTVPYQLSRGCPHKCTFCSEWAFWRRFRPDLPERAADNVRRLHFEYGANYIHFTDSLLNASLKRLQDFAENLLRHRIDIAWGGFMRAQMDLETSKILKRSGCDEVFVGVESFSNESLKLMNKRLTVSDNMQALRAFLEAGVCVVAGLIPGFPGDTRTGFMHSAATLRTLQTEFPRQLCVNTEPFRISPGQPLFSRLEESGLIPKKWDAAYLDIAPQYQDITSTIYCYVDGDNQGLERIGRERIAFMISSDVVVRTDNFVYEEDEDVSINEFTFDHVYGDLCKASIKSNTGHLYTLLVNDAEKEELKEVLAEAPTDGISGKRMARILSSIERRHLIPPSRPLPPLVPFVFRHKIKEDDLVTVSPFVVAREMGWRFKGSILLLNYVNGRITKRPSSESSLLHYIRKEPRSVRQLCRYVKSVGLVRGRFRNLGWLENLKELGVLMVCEESTAGQ